MQKLILFSCSSGLLVTEGSIDNCKLMVVKTEPWAHVRKICAEVKTDAAAKTEAFSWTVINARP